LPDPRVVVQRWSSLWTLSASDAVFTCSPARSASEFSLVAAALGFADISSDQSNMAAILELVQQMQHTAVVGCFCLRVYP
jgi:hypothetical protein